MSMIYFMAYVAIFLIKEIPSESTFTLSDINIAKPTLFSLSFARFSK